MSDKVVSMGLPVGETLNIEKITLRPEQEIENMKRFSIVTGVHGDELEGQYVVYELMRKIRDNISCLKGQIDIYPAVNPLGLEAITRGIPTFDLDMNRCFPGNSEGDMVEHIAAELVGDIMGADLCLDIHSSNIFIREIPQVRLSEKDMTLIPYAKLLNVDFVWVHESQTVVEASLPYSLNRLGVPTLAVEMGVGMRITQEYGNQLVDGIFCVMKEMGIWEGDTIVPTSPIVSTDGDVEYIHAEASGVFLPKVLHKHHVRQGEIVGNIIQPYTGKIEQTIVAPCDGTVFSLREYPVVYEGSLIARILGGVISC